MKNTILGVALYFAFAPWAASQGTPNGTNDPLQGLPAQMQELGRALNDMRDQLAVSRQESLQLRQELEIMRQQLDVIRNTPSTQAAGSPKSQGDQEPQRNDRISALTEEQQLLKVKGQCWMATEKNRTADVDKRIALVDKCVAEKMKARR